eukprot:1160374-Pelagomonas_calceolata.AAC.5
MHPSTPLLLSVGNAGLARCIRALLEALLWAVHPGQRAACDHALLQHHHALPGAPFSSTGGALDALPGAPFSCTGGALVSTIFVEVHHLVQFFLSSYVLFSISHCTCCKFSRGCGGQKDLPNSKAKPVPVPDAFPAQALVCVRLFPVRPQQGCLR